MINISTIIVVKDNPPHILETINSIKDFASEIIIVDIGVDKELKNKLQQNSINQLIELKENIPYVELIREKTKQYAKYDYVLFLDPDEVIPSKLKELLKKEINNYDYFSIPRKNIIFGKWIEHSRWWPDYQVRLFKKDKVVWPATIHRQPKTTGKGYTVETKEENALTHYNYENIDEYFSKFTRYTKAEAQDLKHLTLNETIKKSISEFISRYFAQDGYKDGMHGFILAFFQMFYPLLVYFYFWEKNKYVERDENILPLKFQQFFKQGLIETNFWMINKKLIKDIKSLKTKIINYLLN